MRLATVLTAAGPRAAAFVGTHYVDLNRTDPSPPAPAAARLGPGPAVRHRAAPAPRREAAVRLPEPIKLGPPIPDPNKILCIGLNYRDHAEETGAPIPRDPVLFSKFTTALVGHEADIVLPPVSQEVDYEAELVLVVGRRGKNVPRDQARAWLAGYAVGHDVSARDWQLKKDGKQWLAGKTFDTFAPLGPVLVTADEVPDPHNLGIRLRFNGTAMQDSNTKQMIFRAEDLLA